MEPTEAAPTPISLVEPEAQEQKINLNGSGQSPLPSETVAVRRGKQAGEGFDIDPGPLTAEIRAGNEGAVRERLARQRDIEFHGKKLDYIQKLASDKAAKGESFSDTEADFIRGLSQEDVRHDPKTIMETEYAKKFFERLANSRGGKNPITNSLLNNPKDASVDVDIASNIKARMEIARTVHEDLEERKSKLGWGSTVANYGSQLLMSPLESYRLHNVVSGEKVSFLPGKNLDEQVQFMWTLPTDQFKTVLDKASKELSEKNILTAQKFVEAVSSYGSSDQLLDNVFGIVGLSDLPVFTGVKVAVGAVRGVQAGVARGAAKALSGAPSPNTALQAKTALKDGVKSESGIAPKAPEDILAAQGNIEASAAVTAAKDAQARFKGMDPLGEASRMIGAIPGLFNVQRIVQGVEYLGREAAERVSERLYKNTANLLDSASDVSNVNRLTGAALEAGFKQTEKELKSWYPHLNDAVLDVHYLPGEKQAANVSEVEMKVGKAEGRFAKRPISASDTPADHTRFYHGGTDPTSGGGRWVSQSEKYAKDYRPGEPVHSVDIPHSWLDKKFPDKELYRPAKGMAQSYPSFEAPEQFAKRMKPVARAAEEGQDGSWLADLLPSKTAMNVSIGTPEATLFKTADEAYVWGSKVYKLNPQEYRIAQQGNGFYISVRKAVDETLGDVRDQLAIQTGHQTPKTVFTTFLGSLRTAEDLLSETNRVARHAATHGAQELHRYAVDVAGSIGGLSNKSKNKLITILKKNRDEVYTEGEGAGARERRGVFYNNMVELEQGWTREFGHAPSEKEALAYMSAIQLNSWEWMFRNLGLYRDKARLGIERYRFEYQGFDEQTKAATMYQTEFIEGRLAQKVDWESKNHSGIWVYDKTKNEGKWVSKNEATATERADIDAKLGEGYRLIQVANPLDKPVKKISAEMQETVNFVLVPAAERAPLDWMQLPMRPGGHIEYMHDHWVKQPSMRLSASGKHHYEGDVSISNHATEAEARQFAKDMDVARMLLKDGKAGELDQHLMKTLPYDSNKFKSFFEEGPNGTAARLALDAPIRHTSSGRTVFDTHGPEISSRYPNFRDDIRNPDNLFALIDKKYANEREASTLDTFKAHTVNGQPLFRAEPASLIDPLTAMHKGLANVMRSRHLADYKWKSVEDFIQEFHPYMNVPLEDLRKDPFKYLHQTPWDTLHPDRWALKAGANARQAVLELLGTESELQSNIRWMQEKVLNQIYDKAGQKASDYTAEHLLPFETDPLKALRALGYHSKLGLFNPLQLFLQAQTMTHIAAVSGVGNAAMGSTAALLMRMSKLTNNPQVLDKLAGIAEKMGWKKEEFLESYTHLRKSGLWNVEGEVAMKDDIFEPKMFRGAIGNFLDKGAFFFREGERFTRLAAWNAAYREWKVANPGKEITSEARNEILTRQNTLTVNMTRASNAWWQNGLMSVPTQFFSYQARLMEQFLGKRLTTSEKAHAFGVYSAMYGVPAATGAAIGMWPWYEDLRQKALEHDIDVNSPGMKGLMEGIPSLVWSTVTGDDRNWSQQFGPRGLSFFKDLSEGKVKVLFGASSNILGDMIKSVDPIARGVMSVFSPESEKFEFIAEDFLGALENVSTINNLGKMIFALNTQRFISKNEVYLSDATKMDAIMVGLTGTQPQLLADAYLKAHSLQQEKATKDAISKEIVKNFRRGLQAGFDNDDSSMSKNMRNARLLMIGGGFRPDEQQKIFKDAMNGYESFVDKIQKQWIHDPKHFNKLFNLPEEKN